MRQPSDILSEAQTTAVVGTVMTVIGAVALAVRVSGDGGTLSAILGTVLIGVGQFLVLRSLATWAVSRGTEPLLDELQAIRRDAAIAAARPVVPSP